MNANMSQPPGADPADGRPATHRSAEGVVLFGLAVALPATPVLPILGTDWQAVQLLWIVAVIWTVVASFVQALRQGIRHGDWSAFRCGDIPLSDDDLAWSTKTGRYAYLRIRATHEDLTRAGDRYLQNRDTF